MATSRVKTNLFLTFEIAAKWQYVCYTQRSYRLISLNQPTNRKRIRVGFGRKRIFYKIINQYIHVNENCFWIMDTFGKIFTCNLLLIAEHLKLIIVKLCLLTPPPQTLNMFIFASLAEPRITLR